MKELYVDRGITQSRAAIFNNGQLTNLYIENVDFNSINGNIYKGKIENITMGLNAAFINIGIGKNAILHLEEAQLKSLKRGQEIIVQVNREGTADKGPRVSTVLSIPGKYIVLLPGDNYIGVSKKIEDFELRKRIKDFMHSVHEEGYGVIIRTEGRDIEFDELCEDYNTIKDLWKDIEKKAPYMKAPQLLFNSKDFYEYLIREYVTSDIDVIYVNREVDAGQLKDSLSKIDKGYGKRVKYEEFNFSMQEVIEKEIQRARERRIPLKCGGFIVIDHTEAFTCIDVNSGNFIGEQDVEETILNVNLQASEEIGKAVKLRNITGIILIDFIDMKSERNQRAIIEYLEAKFQEDKSRFKIYGFTRLGILEATRAKKGIRLMDFIYKDVQTGLLNPYYCLKLVENKCLKSFKHYKKNNFEVHISNIIFDEIDDMLQNFINEMKLVYGITLRIIRDENISDFIIGNEGNKS